MKKRFILLLFLLFTLTSCTYINSFFGKTTKESSIPSSSVPNTTIPSISTTTKPGTSISTTTKPGTSIPNITLPSTVVPSTTKPNTTIPTASNTSLVSTTTSTDIDVVVYDDLQIHFLELGNYNAGDCTYIKAGDVDILIDAGSNTSSIPTIKKYINQYCKDGILEYVIATHAHQDHIAGFTSSSGIFSSYECKNIIDFALKNTTSQVSSNYIKLRDQEVALGAKHYTADDCVKETNGASKIFQITETISFEILEQKYYYTKSSDENNYSVCTLFKRGEDSFLFTGDLEEAGEESLVQLNPNLPKVKLFKAGHHGSKTSSNDCLLSLIQPENIAVCCCAGSSEYTGNTDNMFPTQDFINRAAKYTNKIYVTTTCDYTITVAEANASGASKVTGVKVGDEYMKAVSSSYKSLNGNIVFSYDNENNFIVNCSNNNTILKDSEWFNREITLNGIKRKMRTWPSYGV